MSQLPRTIGPYRIVELLGRGGMGVVYRAEHVQTGERAAVKTVRVPRAGLLESLRREIHALRRIQHRGIVRIVDAGLQEGLPWYAMELLEGPGLQRFWTRTTGPFSGGSSSQDSTDQPTQGLETAAPGTGGTEAGTPQAAAAEPRHLAAADAPVPRRGCVSRRPWR
jgi:protein kinase-like protein